MKRTIFIFGFLAVSVFWCYGQNYFRSGIFLHHSTGGCIWGPNGSNTSVPQEMDEYNALHGYTGLQAVTMNEEWWAPGDNEWVTQHAFFEDPSPVTGIGYYLPDNRIIVVKTCFPASAMSEAGQPSDTLYPDMKTVYNYKWHWRHIVSVMRENPENFFVIWTNAPLEPNSTNPSEAALSDWFCTWAKDTLAQGLDPQTGLFPSNVYVFDFFHKLTGPNGMMLEFYAAGPGDSHPNAAATALVAPQFVEEIFNVSINYEVIYGIRESIGNGELLIMVYPNPCNEEAVLRLAGLSGQKIVLSLYDPSGKLIRKIFDGYLPNGFHVIPFPVRRLSQGVYYIKCIRGTATQTVPLLITRES